MGTQSKTNLLQAKQGDFFSGKKERQTLPLDLDVLRSKPTYKAALLYVLQLGGFESEKDVYGELRIDAGNWTRIRQGKVSLSYEQEKSLEELCGNDGLTIWRAYKKGKGVYDLQEAKEKRIAELEAENARLRSDIETLQRYGVIQRAK